MSSPGTTSTNNNVFEQYKLLVEDTARLSDRRQTVSNIYLSANALLASGIALLAVQSPNTELPLSPLYLILLIVGGGIIFCREWWLLIQTYSELVKLRIDLLKELEGRDEFDTLIKIYHREDELYDPKIRQEQKRKPLFGFSRIERRLPILFSGLYVLTLLGVIVSHYPQIVTQFATWGVTLPKP